MKVLIIEDETPAAEKLERYLKRYDPNVEVLSKISSVGDSVNWFNHEHTEVDLIFMDIQLTDGKSFEIFEKANVDKPIIFTTAFDEYALEAFKVNSIDYLLKPITFSDLEKALSKFENLKESLSKDSTQPNLYEALAQLQNKSYKTRFMVKLGEHIRSIPTENIAFFYAEGRDVYLVTDEKRKFIIDYKLEQLEGLLDPKLFNRLNRSFILNINGIKDVVMYSNSRLKIFLHFDFDKEIIVSREKVSPFKEWFNDQ